MSDISDFKDLYLTFGKNFLGASILYFPEISKALNSELNFDTNFWSPLVNRVFIFKENGDNYFVQDDKVSLKIMVKTHLLEQNIFHLLQLQEDFLPITFSYILLKYREHLKAYAFFSQWLIDTVALNIPNLTEDQKLAFKIQNQAYTAHKLELENYFGHLFDDTTNDEPIKDEIDTNSALDAVLESQRKKSHSDRAEGINPQLERGERIKQIKELTASYADQAILKQVFNVDFSATKTQINEKG